MASTEALNIEAAGASKGGATLGSCIVTLSKTIMGCGILCVPFSFGQTGLFLGIAALLFAAAMQAFTLHLLGLCTKDSIDKGEDGSFRSCANIAFNGSKSASMFVETCVAVGCFGCGTSYLIAVGDLIPQICEYAGFSEGSLISRHFWITAVGWCVGLPLMCVSKLDSLKVTSFIGNVGVVYVVAVACMFAVGFLPTSEPKQPISFWPPAATEFTSTPGMVQCIPIFIFAFQCAQNAPSLIVEMENPTMKRVDTMIMVSVLLCSLGFILGGVAGAYAFGASVHGNMLRSFPDTAGTDVGFVSTIARVAVTINVIGSYPLLMHPARKSFSGIFFGKGPDELAGLTWTGLTLTLFVLSWGVAMSVESLDDALAFVGATTGMCIGFSFPAMFYCRLGNGELARSLNANGQGASQPRRGGTWTASYAMQLGSLALIPVLVVVQILKMTQEAPVARRLAGLTPFY